jgi:hypothetical protein
LVPLPRRVGPTAKPPFWHSRKWHPRMLRPDSACHAHANAGPADEALRLACPREPTAESAGGRSGTEDTCPATPTSELRCPTPRTLHAKRREYRATDGHGCPYAALGATPAPLTPTVDL